MRATACFSMYSDMSSRTSAFSSSNRNSASARAAHRVGDGGERLRLPDHAPLELRLEPREPLALRLEHLRDRDPRPLGDDLRDVFGVDFLFQVLALLLDLGQALFRLGNFPLERGDPPVADLRGLL